MTQHAAFFVLYALIFSGTSAAGAFTLTLSDGDEIPVEVHAGGADRILWLPSEYGLRREAHQELADGLVQLGYEVWLVDLHSAWFLTPGRSSYDEVKTSSMAELISMALPDNGRLYLVSEGRGAALLLEGLHHWRKQQPGAPATGGMVLLHPNLLATTPKPGEAASYRPITRAINQPIVLFQPLLSAKRWHLEELADELRAGGSTLYLWPLPGVSDGFQSRPDATEPELQERKILPRKIDLALRQLKHHNGQRRVQPPLDSQEESTASQPVADGLQPVNNQPPAPPLTLTNLNGEPYSEERSGKILLINFWATWCPPCVKEIPSLGRLQQRFSSEQFEVIGVSVGEPPEIVGQFLQRVPANFPIYLDPAGKNSGPWRLRAFPSTFILDQAGRIRLSYYGALELDSAPVIEQIKSLISETQIKQPTTINHSGKPPNRMAKD
jgi:thiol-disulfide isomerase/thioredoxin